MEWLQINPEQQTRQWKLLRRCHKRSCAARTTSLGTDMLQQTNGHNHPVNPPTTRVEEIKSKLRKRAREEVSPVPTLYNEELV